MAKPVFTLAPIYLIGDAETVKLVAVAVGDGLDPAGLTAISLVYTTPDGTGHYNWREVGARKFNAGKKALGFRFKSSLRGGAPLIQVGAGGGTGTITVVITNGDGDSAPVPADVIEDV